MLCELLTDPLSHSVGVVAPFMICRQHFFQNQQHTWDESSALSTAQLTLKTHTLKLLNILHQVCMTWWGGNLSAKKIQVYCTYL